MRTRYAVILGILSGLVSFFLFTFLDFYAFMSGPSWWFNPVDEYILPIIVGLVIANLVSNKFNMMLRIYLNLISGVVSYVGSYAIVSILIFIHQLLI
ncbi:hypothetical protein [Stygiolobus caldivivus]|uniref:Uncharacterized protein n=1 Tax=Stygiolobus caldivivus TaxID=2824673 RepID=A0A8D5U4M1_9CREN|nr:hypothetical protein [Stygiolobus caldivivus]BCU68962.1 hypothetical protein KN1_02590 [Stygiolobus caldivivus]